LALSYDMAFFLEPFPPSTGKFDLLKQTDGSKPLVGLNVSGLLYHGGYTRNNMFGLRTGYKELIHQIIAHFIEKRGAQVVLVPHVFGPETDLESDPAACAAICRELSDKYRADLHVISGEYDQHEIKWLIGKCDFFLGSRMHACIAALSQSVPAVGLAYSKKFFGVLRTIGVEQLVVDLRDCDAAKTIDLIDRAYSSRAEIRADLVQRMPAVKQAVSGLFTRIVIAPNEPMHPKITETSPATAECV